ncbi:hypothetical protein MYU51_001703 [Penicillium brevicompactum]
MGLRGVNVIVEGVAERRADLSRLIKFKNGLISAFIVLSSPNCVRIRTAPLISFKDNHRSLGERARLKPSSATPNAQDSRTNQNNFLTLSHEQKASVRLVLHFNTAISKPNLVPMGPGNRLSWCDLCDEVRPVCSNCKQREEDCNYVSAASYLWASEKKPRTRTRKRKQPPSKDVEQTSSPPSDAPFSLLDRCDHTPPISHPAPPPLDITQLRLLVNWQKNTCCFFSRDEDTRIVWQVFLVDEALESPSLMHGILAVSALHLALSEPASEQSFWFGLATAYKGEALYALRHNLTEMTPEKAKFMMGLSALAVVYAFGSVLTDVDDVQPGLDALNNVFILCRGVQQITGQAHSYLQQSNFAPLFNPGEPTVAVPDHVQQSLDHLDYLNTEYNEDDNDTATYSQVITAMRSLSAHAFAQPNSMTLAAGWAIRVPSQRYVTPEPVEFGIEIAEIPPIEDGQLFDTAQGGIDTINGLVVLRAMLSLSAVPSLAARTVSTIVGRARWRSDIADKTTGVLSARRDQGATQAPQDYRNRKEMLFLREMSNAWIAML